MQRHWLAVVEPERYASERAYARDTLDLPIRQANEGDPVVLVAATDPPVLFGLGVARPDGIRYTHRLFDHPPALDRSFAPGLTAVVPGPTEAPGPAAVLPGPIEAPGPAAVLPGPTEAPGPTAVVPGPIEAPGLMELSAGDFRALTEAVGAERRVDGDRSEWFVMVALPIEAGSRAEAVREFWTYVEKLGPTELPAFVWPRGQELAMQAFLLGERVNLDPEEDETDDADDAD